MYCPQCGNELASSGNFCAHCGTDVSSFTATVDLAAEETEPASATNPEPKPTASTGPETAPEPSASATASTEPSSPPEPSASPAPALASAAGAAPAAIPVTTVVIAAAAVVIVAALIVLFAMRGLGAPSPQPAVQADRVSEHPSVATSGGAEVKAISRPSFYDLLPAEPEPEGESNEEQAPSVAPYAVEDGLSNVVNTSQWNLTDQERSLIEQNGFAISVGAGGDEFFEAYELNRYAMNPNFVTVDSMMHTYHLYFSYLLKKTERTALSSSLAALGHAMMQASADQLDQLKGTEWEDAALRNVAFFAVGSALIDPSTQVPGEVSDVVAAEAALAQSADGISESPLFGSEEDYSQYKPRGYYEGDADLERYFRTMMWYGRRNFTQSDEGLDRSALLMTLALQGDSLASWEGIYAVTSFFAGASDDCGYYEYYPVAQAAYGEDVTVADLADNDAAWKSYHALTAQMPVPKINSVIVHEGEDDDVLSDEKGFRFMGQRFSLDASIFQQLIYSRVGENSAGAKRMLPNALDVPAALGSDEALSILDAKGETSYAGYSEHMRELRDSISEDDAALWNASLYSQWLYTLNPLLTPKGEGYPAFMQSQQWTRKNLQTYLGSYTELKHDTVLYSKQAIAEMGGMVPEEDDRGYVECEPEVFSRLARLTQATSLGLAGYGMIGAEDADNLALLQQLAEQLATIAEKELRDELPNDAEFELIRSYGGQIEHFWKEVYKDEAESRTFKAKQFPAAIVTDVATDPNGTVLELGTGKVSTIKVVVPVDGTLRIAEGTVYSFYQFEQPLSNRLTDSAWREMLGSVPIEDWTTGFQFVDQRYS